MNRRAGRRTKRLLEEKEANDENEEKPPNGTRTYTRTYNTCIKYKKKKQKRSERN